VLLCPIVLEDPSYVFLEDYRHLPSFVTVNCLLQIGEAPACSWEETLRRTLECQASVSDAKSVCRRSGSFLYFSGTQGNATALDAMGGPTLMYYRLVGDFPQCEDLRYQVRVDNSPRRKVPSFRLADGRRLSAFFPSLPGVETMVLSACAQGVLAPSLQHHGLGACRMTLPPLNWFSGTSILEACGLPFQPVVTCKSEAERVARDADELRRRQL
jgi:hypothetical protein